MSDPRLLVASPSTIRLVAAAAAAVASLGVVALGVQLGTNGLVGDGPGRNPGSASASPAAAVVDLAPSRPTTSFQETLSALPLGGAVTFASTAAAAPSPAPVATPTEAPTATPTPPPTPTPGPTDDLPPAPIDPPVLPAPVPTVPPALDPVVEPVVDLLSDTGSGLGVAPAAPESASEPTTLAGLVDQLLGGL